MNTSSSSGCSYESEEDRGCRKIKRDGRRIQKKLCTKREIKSSSSPASLNRQISGPALATINIEDSDENANYTTTEEEKLCELHDVKDGTIKVFIHDYLTLKPEVYINDVIIDFKLRHYQHVMSQEKQQQDVFILLSSFYEALTREAGLPEHRKSHARLQVSTRSAKLGQQGGSQAVLLPVCKDDHWFLLVALISTTPSILVLDSMGGNQDKAACLFRDFLCVEMRNVLVNKSIPIIHRKVPTQQNGFDCGLFVLSYAERVIEDLKSFVLEARSKDGLSSWFSAIQVNNKREEVAALIRKLSIEQAEDRIPVIPEIEFEMTDSMAKVEEVSTVLREVQKIILDNI